VQDQTCGLYGELGHQYLGKWNKSRDLAFEWKKHCKLQRGQLQA